MASSGSKEVTVATLRGSSTKAVGLRLSWQTRSQSVDGNTSVVRFTLQVVTYASGAMYGSASQSWNIKVNGSTRKSGSFKIQQSSNSTKTLGYVDVTISHDSIGDADFDASGYASFNMTFGGKWVDDKTVSLSGTLNRIPRASTPTVSGTLNIGDQLTVSTNRASSSFTHDITYLVGDASGTIGTGVGASTTWTPPMSLCDEVTGSTTVDCVITCKTYSGSTLIGTKSTTVKLKVPSTVVPTFVSSSVTDGKGHLSTYGAYVQGQSEVVVTAEAQGAYGSTITGYEASLDGLTGTASGAGERTITLGAPPTSGERSVVLKATDTRGRAITGTKAITVAPYSAPTLSLDAYRCDVTTGEESDESTTIRVAGTAGVTDVNSAGINSGTVTVQHRLKGADSWTTDATTVTGTSGTYTCDITGCPETSAYEVRAQLVDGFGTVVEMMVEVGTARPVMDFRGDGTGVAFYGIADRPGVRVNAPLAVGNDYGIDLEDDAGVSQPFLRVQQSGRPTITNHTALENQTWLQGMLASGAATNLLRVNETGQVELGWTQGGMRGRVMKLLWSGSWVTGSIVVPEAPYYNVFVFGLSESVSAILCARTPGAEGSGWTYIRGCSPQLTGNAGSYWWCINASANGTQMAGDAAVVYNGDPAIAFRTGHYKNGSTFVADRSTITEIWGVV